MHGEHSAVKKYADE